MALHNRLAKVAVYNSVYLVKGIRIPQEACMIPQLDHVDGHRHIDAFPGFSRQ